MNLFHNLYTHNVLPQTGLPATAVPLGILLQLTSGTARQSLRPFMSVLSKQERYSSSMVVTVIVLLPYQPKKLSTSPYSHLPCTEFGPHVIPRLPGCESCSCFSCSNSCCILTSRIWGIGRRLYEITMKYKRWDKTMNLLFLFTPFNPRNVMTYSSHRKCTQNRILSDKHGYITHVIYHQIQRSRFTFPNMFPNTVFSHFPIYFSMFPCFWLFLTNILIYYGIKNK